MNNSSSSYDPRLFRMDAKDGLAEKSIFGFSDSAEEPWLAKLPLKARFTLLIVSQ
ncbi:hypothetical protein [Paenibacillus andongensis]|uniref:hypothetical protein n=1 Tax=Paenibacillus andongensis TaxID=2975482 RepID=UPI0021BAFC05|nr:hypothetical protein [Paenibacillus andongensis]